MAKPVDEVLQELEQEAERDRVPIIREAERKLLVEAASLACPKRILEIGTAIGYSSLVLASHFPEAFIETIEIDEGRYRRACRAAEEAGVSDRWKGYLGDAAAIIPQLSGPYDFVYLDGPKGQYLRQLQAIEPLLSKRAVIAADNVLFRGLVKKEGPVPHRYRTLVYRLREYIDYVETHYNTTIYEEGDGLAVSRRKENT